MVENVKDKMQDKIGLCLIDCVFLKFEVQGLFVG